MRVRRLNRYVEESRPWELAGEESKGAEFDRVLYNLVEGVRMVTLLLHPYMPEATDRLLAAFGGAGHALSEFGSRDGGQRVEQLPPLFPKLEKLDG